MLDPFLWRTFFRGNMQIVLFVYGLVFFVMGFAILVRNRGRSEVPLARRLNLLGIFALLHGVADWGNVFIPIQAAYSSPVTVQALRLLQVIISTVSFVHLLLFGWWLAGDSLPGRWWRWRLPWALFGVWLASFILYPVLLYPGHVDDWIRAADIWSRYLFAFPGSLLAACSVALQGHDLNRRGMQQLVVYTNWAVAAFLGYALVGGLVVPAAPFPPANVINAERFFAYTGLPIQILRGLAGFGLAYIFVRLLEIFDIEAVQRLEEARAATAVLAERTRIARELHDGVIQSLYALGLKVERLRRKAERGQSSAQAGATEADSPGFAAELAAVVAGINGAIADLRQYIMGLRASSVELPLREQLTQLVENLRASFAGRLELAITPEPLPQLPEEPAQDILLWVREAVTNAIRHARARTIAVQVQRSGDALHISVKDDGRGFDPPDLDRLEPADGLGPEHHGLRNLRTRAERLGGQTRIYSSPGAGTEVRLSCPCPGGVLQPGTERDVQG